MARVPGMSKGSYELLGRRALEVHRVKDYVILNLRDEQGEVTEEQVVVCYDNYASPPVGLRAVVLLYPVREYVDLIGQNYLFVDSSSPFKAVRQAVRATRQEIALHYANPDDDDWYSEGHIPEEELVCLNAAEAFWYLMMLFVQDDIKTIRKLDEMIEQRGCELRILEHQPRTG